METVKDRLDALRCAMCRQGVAACVVPSTDPHLSEYPPEHWKSRARLTGFTGSAGTAAVTLDKAGLWTDSRYFLQAEMQLRDIALFRQGLPSTPEPAEWLCSELSEGDTVGIDGSLFSAADAKTLIETFNNKGIGVDIAFCPMDGIWKDRPPLPATPVYVLDREFTGRDAGDKIAALRVEMAKRGAATTIVSALDQIAWLLNLRASDVSFTPVFLSYLIVSTSEAVLFTDLGRIPAAVRQYLDRTGVGLKEYSAVESAVGRIENGSAVLVCLSEINYALYSRIPSACRKIETEIHPLSMMKAVKNGVETEGFRRAMLHDGVAMVRFLMTLENRLRHGERITELDVARLLLNFRSDSSLFRGESFSTIAGFGAHGAIVHYEADEASDSEIKPDGLLLVDSGGQYVCGTTDLTRTIATGKTSREMRFHYTLVLKGLIALSSAVFPRGTRGIQLDILARQFLWQHGLSYMHGTGHGVGCFLSVHEGPHGIRTNYLPAAIEEGMITSIEPGIYIEGRYGIRIENLAVAVPAETTAFGEFLSFQTLTLCPLDTTLIDCSLLTESEIVRIDNYHRQVFDRLEPLLNDDEKDWLRRATATLKKTI
jgi:Xaa-Pro aminopeptidase